MGDIIRLCVDDENPMGLYQYELPKLPNENEIWYYNVRKADQYWRTPHGRVKWLNPDGSLKNVKHMTERERIEYIEYWRNVWEDGLWIMINGEPTYLTGAHVEHLVFNKFKSKNFAYDDGQRHRFYFRDLTNRDPICDGRLWVKGRRVGLTSEEITESIRVLISDFSNNVGAQSDTHPKAKSTIMSKIIDTYVKREPWMREEYYSANGKIPRSELELTSIKAINDGNYPLGGKARVFPTTPKAADGEEFMLYIMDEFSKWFGLSPYETYGVNKKTIVNPGKRGKMDVLSTTGDSEEAKSAVRDWHQIISDSNPKVRDKNGKTNSGLYYYFVSYVYSFELWENYPQIKDKYGRINVAMAEEIIENEVNKYPKDSKKYIYERYRMPTRMKHALLTASTQTYFSRIRISLRLEELRDMPWDQKPYVIGSLEEDENGMVYFESNQEKMARCERMGIPYEPGHWMIAVQPFFSIDRGINLANRFRVSADGILHPPINPEGAIGYDPIRYRKGETTSNNLSDAAIIVHKKLDYYGAGDSNRYCALWVHRPDDPRQATREAIKACKFWGYPMMYERTMDAVIEDFEDAKMVPFLLRSEKDNKIGMVVDNHGKMVQNGLDMMINRFKTPQNDDEIDQLAEMPFEPVLYELDSVDISRTTQFNIFMAMVELEHGLKQITYTNASDDYSNQKMQIINQIFPTRN